MPTTLKGWAGLCLLLAAMLFPSLSQSASSQGKTGSGYAQKASLCAQQLHYHRVIAQLAIGGTDSSGTKHEGMSKEAIHADAQKHVDAVELEKIDKILDEAFAAPDMAEWFKKYWNECMGFNA